MGLRELVRLTLGSAHARGGDWRDVPGCPASVRRLCEQNKGGLGKSARAPRRDDGEFPEGLAGWARLSEEERACAATLFHTAATWDELVRSAGASQPRRT